MRCSSTGDRGNRSPLAAPSRVAADRWTRANWVAIREFCNRCRVVRAVTTFYRDASGYNAYCFAERERAEQFCARFDGEIVEQQEGSVGLKGSNLARGTSGIAPRLFAHRLALRDAHWLPFASDPSG
jgi:hypothetical protein